jgi:RimJ/RimL family protein N-acetyltransferase
MSAGVSLRQVEPDDRWLFWEWRNSERIRRVSTQDREIPRESHSLWFDQRFPAMRDRTILVEWGGNPVGWFQIEDWSAARRTGEWGLGLGISPSTPGLGGAIPILALGHAFDRLNAERMTGRVLGLNSNMVSIMRRLTVPIESEQPEVLERADGSTTTMLVYQVTAADWPTVRSAGLELLPSALRASVRAALASPVAG